MNEQDHIDGKTARELLHLMVGAPDFYRHNIYQASLKLVVDGYGAAVYQTQWASGTTLWAHGENIIQVKVAKTP